MLNLNLSALRMECQLIVREKSISEVARRLDKSRTAIRNAITQYRDPWVYLGLRLRIIQEFRGVELDEVTLAFREKESE